MGLCCSGPGATSAALHTLRTNPDNSIPDLVLHLQAVPDCMLPYMFHCSCSTLCIMTVWGAEAAGTACLRHSIMSVLNSQPPECNHP